MTRHPDDKPFNPAAPMEMLEMDGIDDPLVLDSIKFSPPSHMMFLPPAPQAKTSNKHLNRPTATTETLYRDTAASRFRRQGLLGIEKASGWNGSTQIVKGYVKPLMHQILNRNFEPPAPTIVEPKTTKQLVNRLSKATVSSRMKEAAAALATPSATTHMAQHTGAVEVDRKRLHLQHRQAVTAMNRESRPPDARGGREGIQLLLFYRKEVEKRLRQDPLYALHHDTPLQN